MGFTARFYVKLDMPLQNISLDMFRSSETAPNQPTYILKVKHSPNIITLPTIHTLKKWDDNCEAFFFLLDIINSIYSVL